MWLAVRERNRNRSRQMEEKLKTEEEDRHRWWLMEGGGDYRKQKRE